MLFAFDLDGTIITRNDELPAATRAAILALRGAGHQVTVITGRHHTGAQRALDGLGVSRHFGTCNGARVHADGDDHHLERHLDGEVVSYLLGRFTPDSAQNSAQFFLSTRDRMYVRDPAHERWERARQDGREVWTPADYGGEGAHKFILMSDQAASLAAELSQRFPENASYLWEHNYLEVMAAGADKGQALQRIAAHYGIPQSDTVAFGDGPNDLEMLSWAGRAIGVGTLAPGVAELIDDHVPGPEELGVARWLERYVPL